MENFPKLLRTHGYIQHGPNWPADHPTRECVAVLFGIDDCTVKRYMAEANTYAADNPDVARSKLVKPPKKTGPAPRTVEEQRATYQNLYAVLRERFLAAKQGHETLTIDKLLDHVRSAAKTLKRQNKNDKTYWIEVFTSGQLKDEFETMRYHLIRLGFSYGQIKFTLKSYRSKPYVMGWLKKYCEMRLQAVKDGVRGKLAGVVDIFGDETGIWKHEHGRWSWYLDGDNAWDKIKRKKGEKWGIAQFLFAWWEEVAEFDHLSEYEQHVFSLDGLEPPAKKSKGKTVYYTRRVQTFKECLEIWNIRWDGTMKGTDFEGVIERLCEFVKEGHFARAVGAKKTQFKARFHLDNASYHKRKKITAEFDPNKPRKKGPNKATPDDYVAFLIENSPYFDSPNDCIDEDTGEYFSLDTLKQACVAVWRPGYVEQTIHNNGFEVFWSAPYWSEGMPVELYWAGLKGDYRKYDKKWRDRATIEKFVYDYARKVLEEEFELKGLVEHTDKWVEKVLNRDPATLNPLELGNFPT
jgi:hypothetical protein